MLIAMPTVAQSCTGIKKTLPVASESAHSASQIFLALLALAAGVWDPARGMLLDTATP